MANPVPYTMAHDGHNGDTVQPNTISVVPIVDFV